MFNLKRIFGKNKKRHNLGGGVHPTVQILGEKYVSLGANCCVGESTWININAYSSTSISLSIGDNSFIGRRNVIDVGAYLEIGPFFLSGVNCQILGSNHKIDNPKTPYILSGSTLGKGIKIGANCWLGSNVVVSEGVNLGHGTIVGANCIVTKDVPPFSIVVGNPGRITKRFSFVKNKWIQVSNFVKEDEDSIIEENEYINMLRSFTVDVNTIREAAGEINL
jgi:acetyltransferase-like isoleucine patch superfamily enzyme